MGPTSEHAESHLPPHPSSTRTRPVQIPEEVAAALERRIRGSGFSDVDAFVSFVLARLLDHPADEPFSPEEERQLKERLRSLGYID